MSAQTQLSKQVVEAILEANKMGLKGKKVVGIIEGASSKDISLVPAHGELLPGAPE